MLIVHHLGRAPSERVVWLCEELGLPYELVRYERDRETILAPAEFKALHPMGVAPLLEDDGVLLAEAGAIVEYILAKYGAGRLSIAPDQLEFADYLHWFHFANGTLQLAMSRCLWIRRLSLPAENPVLMAAEGRLERAFGYVDNRLKAAPWFAGQAFTAADIMMGFSLTTMRLFLPVSLESYPGIRAYLQRVGLRQCYRRAMAKGDPGFVPLLS
jgi:glutathione S-transferase